MADRTRGAAAGLGLLACVVPVTAAAADQLLPFAWMGLLTRSPRPPGAYSWFCPESVCDMVANASAVIVPPVASQRPSLSGRASFYDRGTVTASGERFVPLGLTASHPSLPFGTRLRITNKTTGLSVVVRVNDRVHLAKGIAIDISLGAARALGMEKAGIAPVDIVQVD